VKLVIGRLPYKVNVLITLRRHSPLIRVLFWSFHTFNSISKYWRT
ncbi:hypothetical protein Anas_12041, partial [Armadillidium nasatum]